MLCVSPLGIFWSSSLTVVLEAKRDDRMNQNCFAATSEEAITISSGKVELFVDSDKMAASTGKELKF